MGEPQFFRHQLASLEFLQLPIALVEVETRFFQGRQVPPPGGQRTRFSGLEAYTGFEMGTQRWGGYAEVASVLHEWTVLRPEGLTLRESMILGTAGLTAALCVDALQKHDVEPERGEVVVTGTGEVIAPSEKLILDPPKLPEITLRQ